MTTDAPPPAPAAAPEGEAARLARELQPLALHAQYLRDLSFESPAAPASLSRARQAPPRVEVRLDLAARLLGTEGPQELHEVLLKVRVVASPPPSAEGGQAGQGGGDGEGAEGAQGGAGEGAGEASEGAPPYFVAELEYAGAFQTPESDPAAARYRLLTEGAGLLFPYARKQLADMTQEGGFQPVLLAPVDFHALYRVRQAAEQEAAAAAASAPPRRHQNGGAPRAAGGAKTEAG